MQKIEIIPMGSDKFFSPPLEFYTTLQEQERINRVELSSIAIGKIANILMFHFPQPTKKEIEIQEILVHQGSELRKTGITENMHEEEIDCIVDKSRQYSTEYIAGKALTLTTRPLIPYREIMPEFHMYTDYSEEGYSLDKKYWLQFPQLKQFIVDAALIHWMFKELNIQ